jgi:hypothetical protein
MPLEDIVNVEITVSTVTVAQQGFGVPLVLAYHNAYPDRVRAYGSSTWQSELVADGIAATTPAYLAIRAIMAQSPKPKLAKLGRRSAPETQIVHITPTAGSGNAIHRLTIEASDGTVYPISFTEGGSPTVAAIATGLAAAVNATTAPVTADGASGTHVILTADAPNVLFSYYDLSSTLKLTDHTVVTAVGTDLDAVWAENSDWYGLSLATPAPAAIEAAADWAETHPVLFAPQTHDAGCADAAITTDVMSSLEGQAYARSPVSYHARALQFLGAAVLSARLTGEPGDATWKFTSLRGITPDKLTTAQQNAIRNKHGNYYVTIAGRNVFIEGWAPDGSFPDLTQLSDWTVARIKESVFALFAGSRKVPMSDQGGRQLYGAIWNAVAPAMDGRRYVKYDGNPETHRVVVPAVADLPEADRAARRWSGIEFSFRAANAVHSAGTIRGTITI